MSLITIDYGSLPSGTFATLKPIVNTNFNGKTFTFSWGIYTKAEVTFDSLSDDKTIKCIVYKDGTIENLSDTFGGFYGSKLVLGKTDTGILISENTAFSVNVVVRCDLYG